MLVVAAAVGVASCFGAPISGERVSKGSELGTNYFHMSSYQTYFHFCFPLVSFTYFVFPFILPHTSAPLSYLYVSCLSPIRL